MVCIDKLTKLIRLVPCLVGDGELTTPGIARLFLLMSFVSTECRALFYMIMILGLQVPFGKHCLNYEEVSTLF